MPTLEERGFRFMLRGPDARRLRVTAAAVASEVGKEVVGTINRMGAYMLNTDLGGDVRGKRMLEISAEGCPQLSQGDVLQDLKNNERFMLTELGLDGPAYSKRFGMKQLTEKDS